MRLVVISNRVPAPTAATGAGGLAVALREALSRTGGIWFGWSGDRSAERALEPSVVQASNIAFTTVPLTDDDFERYYCGYSNRVLWPLFHEQLHAMEYRDTYRESYEDVNTYFADVVAARLEPDDFVWIHDYHLIPLAEELRKRGVTAPIGFFLHIPFPPFDVFRALPKRRSLLRSFFSYDLVGFQTAMDARHFADAVTREIGASVGEDGTVAEMEGQRVRFSDFPIGIDVAATSHTALASRSTDTGQRLTRALRGRKLVIGADRLDYTKGLVDRFLAFERFLEKYGSAVDDQMIYVQITAPSRENVEEYQEITRQLEAEAGRINGCYNSIYWTPLRLIEQQVPRNTLLGYFSLSHVGLVTPLRDGMNLVAKEYLAAQTPEDPGVLVLSSLAGAAEELGDSAVLVNPYSADEVAEGIYRALSMPFEERRSRWERGIEVLESNTAEIWRERFLDVLQSCA